MTTKRAPATKRIRQPLTPVDPVVIIDGDDYQTLPVEQITEARVGLKAFGLCSLPKSWTKPFFVITGGRELGEGALRGALQLLGIQPSDRVLVRSSGTNETIESRGALVSSECRAADIADCVRRSNALIGRRSAAEGIVHWIVQELVPTTAKGHVSNERRISKDLRDWTIEIEPSPGSPADTQRIAIRPWRDASKWKAEPLSCKYRAHYVGAIENVARWAYDRQIRVHFEWVWDGNQIFIVQADECDAHRDGADPRELVKKLNSSSEIDGLTIFRRTTEREFASYRKLANAALYRRLGYAIVDFFILDNPDVINSILTDEAIDDRLFDDLRILTTRPLVIRTDGLSIPDHRKQMLPRSDELRSPEAARAWLTSNFRKAINEADLGGSGLCLIAHHFVPATSSAWCQAHPDQRRVRIEALWGIPEGLYWYAHDVYDVDTQTTSLSLAGAQPVGLRIRERVRYKERFIAPDETGAWVVHRTCATADWTSSIKHSEWVKEIAWTSRRIANATGKSVVVMWLIDIPKSISKHRVLPWYHEPWHASSTPFKAAPRKKTSTSTEQVIRSATDWAALKERLASGEPVVRVRVEPTESDLVRDPEFAQSLAEAAKKSGFVVELAGGVLSHAYYMLSRTGCAVECTDLDDYATEEDGVEFNKLVRDKIPDAIVSRGENVVLYRLEGEALIAALRRKLVEEAFEVLDARTTSQIAEELADLFEVANSLAERLGIKKEEIENSRKIKLKNRGRFDKALMLTRTALTPPLSSSPSDGQGNIDETATLQMRIDKTISQVSELPITTEDIHADKRRDLSGALERQFTFKLSSVVDEYKPTHTSFSLETPDGNPHTMTIEIALERKGPDLRSRIRLINAPAQLDLDL